LERGDCGIAKRLDRGDAGTRRLAVDEHGAGAALREPAAEFGAVERQIVAQDVEQRGVGFRWDRTTCSIDLEFDRHRRLPASSGVDPRILVRATAASRAAEPTSRQWDKVAARPPVL